MRYEDFAGCVDCARRTAGSLIRELGMPRGGTVCGAGAGIRYQDGKPTGEPCVQVFVTEKMPGMAGPLAAPSEIHGHPVDVVEVGIFRVPFPEQHFAMPPDHRDWKLARRLRRRLRQGVIGIPQDLLDELLKLFEDLCRDRPPPATGRFRPVPPGVSVGHTDVTAGTVGTWCVDQEDDELVMLSNNHVVANRNAADPGDAVLQPGVHDGGRNPADRIGSLKRFVPIGFGSGDENLVDAAIVGAIDPANIDLIIRVISQAAVTYHGRESIVPEMPVQKSGRTTGHTNGTIRSIGATANVNYGNGRTARFVDQILVNPGTFSDGGDSGSGILDVPDEGPLRLVGLLFAGSDFFTVANPFHHVADSMNLRVATEADLP